MRKVTIFKYEKKEGNEHYDKVEDGKAKFHAWGVDYEEYESGPGNFSTAIIEREDGSVQNICANMIKFDANNKDKNKGINYKELLEKYIKHVYESEGTCFISSSYEHPTLTNEEWNVLEGLSEIQDLL